MGRLRFVRGRCDTAVASPAGNGVVRCLRPSCALDGDHAWELADAVVNRVFGYGQPPFTVVLDLEPVAETDDAGCAALLALHRGLQIGGVRLRLAAVRPYLLEQLRHGGVTSTIGADAIYPNVRTAVLAAYAGRPGPAVVTRSVRIVLAEPPEPVLAEPVLAEPVLAEPVLAEPVLALPAAMSAPSTPAPAGNGGAAHPSMVEPAAVAHLATWSGADPTSVREPSPVRRPTPHLLRTFLARVSPGTDEVHRTAADHHRERRGLRR